MDLQLGLRFLFGTLVISIAIVHSTFLWTTFIHFTLTVSRHIRSHGQSTPLFAAPHPPTILRPSSSNSIVIISICPSPLHHRPLYVHMYRHQTIRTGNKPQRRLNQSSLGSVFTHFHSPTRFSSPPSVSSLITPSPPGNNVSTFQHPLNLSTPLPIFPPLWYDYV